jgi:hypothetical protein
MHNNIVAEKHGERHLYWFQQLNADPKSDQGGKENSQQLESPDVGSNGRQ